MWSEEQSRELISLYQEKPVIWDPKNPFKKTSAIWAMIWEPLNLTTTCPADTNISVCSEFGFIYLNLLIKLYSRPLDGIKDEEDSGDKKEYDFIVVGAGAAGCVVANRLSANPKWTVLLIEAGPEQPKVTSPPGLSTSLLNSDIDWQYKTEPNGKSCLAREEGRCSWPRGKLMGGSSSINSMSYIRGNREDYDGWYKLGNPGWSYDEVLPFFKKSEKNLNPDIVDKDYHGFNGEQPISQYPYIDKPSKMITEAFNEKGLPLVDYNGAEQEGSMQAQAFSKNGERVSTYSAFIHPIRYKRKNLTIKPNSEVTKIILKNKRAVGVVVKECENKTFNVRAKKEVIICSGAINSPQLLMLSGIGPKNHLEALNIPVIKDLAVGENLHDHVTFNGIIIALPNKTATLVNNEEVLNNVQEYHDLEVKNNPLSGNGPVNSIAFLKSEANLSAPDVEYQVNHVTHWKEFIREPIAYESLAILPSSHYDGVLPRTENLLPLSRGWIHLDPDNPYRHPKIYANYFDIEADFLPLLRGVKFLLSLEDTRAFKSNGAYFVREPLPACKDYEWGTDDYIICLAKSYTSSTYHPVGTCKMGPQEDPKAVVDNHLKVYGIRGLRVIDASIMPVAPRGNTNAPSIMIGERGVDFVIKYWKHFG